MNPLLDSEFLIKLNSDRNRIIYAHIISLNQYEHPIEQLEGIVTAGSISIDGQSAVRRTCSLTLSAKNLNINNVYWGLTTKIKIEIGIQNNIIDSNYDDIIWFSQGIFILTDFKTSQSINNYTINLSGKDKMCLLNGDVAGNIPVTTFFDSYADRTGQRHIVNLDDYNEEKNEYIYNNFLDDDAALAIQEGFQAQYGNDYPYVRNIKKIISLQYKPAENINSKEDLKDTTIQFSITDKPVSLSNLISDTFNDNGFYEINLDESYITGFIVNNCKKEDIFSWEIEQKIPIPIIIQELLHQYGQERYSNIIIKDIEPYALEMLDSDFEEDLYLLYNGKNYVGLVTKEKLIADYRLYLSSNSKNDKIIETDEDGEIINFIFESSVGEDNSSLIDIMSGSTISEFPDNVTKIVKADDITQVYVVRKILAQESIGYGMILLTYPDELKANVGESITSVLDKIVNMLGDYEYFYDLKGQFVFQAKPAYVKTAWNDRIVLDKESYIDASELSKKVIYTFDDSSLTTQYQNSPNINNIKNDYIIWGEKKLTSGKTQKFHGRYVIQNRPIEYTDFNGYTWTSKRNTILKDATNMNGQKRQYALDEDVDWRHLINIMAEDWYHYHTRDDYEIILRQNNNWILRQNNNWPDLEIDLFPFGRTGFEQYYIDFVGGTGCWGSLYDIYSILLKYYQKHPNLIEHPADDEEDLEILSHYEYEYNKKGMAENIVNSDGYLDNYFADGKYKYWHQDVLYNPEKLIFWFDFFNADEMGIGKFATSVIGDRPKTINDTAIKTIIYRDTPDVIYCSWNEYQLYKAMMILKDGYDYIIINNNNIGYPATLLNQLNAFLIDLTSAREENRQEDINLLLQKIKELGYTEQKIQEIFESFGYNIRQNFIRSIRGKTVHGEAENMLYQYSYYNDNVTITSIPIYYLQPNTIISTKDELSRVTGYYILTKINISLAYNGTMSLTAIKSPERIY